MFATGTITSIPRQSCKSSHRTGNTILSSRKEKNGSRFHMEMVPHCWEDKVKQEDNAAASLACRWEDLKKEFKPTKPWDVEHVTIMGQSNTK
ncbi:uncharacterized protein LOC141893766 isoform X2 [Acropora palmata]|uniref:uncharacterized protein LOC141893766 isoform X2 n=1 Tax=Acropora palmata TaxID=6131 RepID=UPI003DA14101